MITSPRGLIRASTDARMQASALEWLNDQPAGRWITIADALPHIPLTLDQCSWAFNSWLENGWMEQRRDSGRVMWRPTEGLPIVTKRTRSERDSWGNFFSSLLELPVR